ncbi:MAG: tRNA adenosine(34) deaminase TadA [Deltaproteobacteria bacterium]|jgi:tRNA(adenine34) deaminase
MTGQQRSEDRQWMERSIEEAGRAAHKGEVPVGALLVVGGWEAGRGHNLTITAGDPTAHAEVVTLRAAAKALGNHRTGGTMYVTLEPCLMCMGALLQARVERLVFATRDPKAGAVVSLYQVAADSRLNHSFEISEGLCGEEAASLLSDFFRARRAREGAGG